ncbi:hypothetical protein GINT2_001904 [Glugoides intestinalis]
MKRISIEEQDDYISINGHKIYVNKELRKPLLEEYERTPENSAITQFASTSKLNGLICSIGLPDFHIGYALPIGSVAVIDLSDPEASISPDGIGFDINCGVRCLKTNLFLEDFLGKGGDETSRTGCDVREMIAERLSELMPFEGLDEAQRPKKEIIDEILNLGMKYLLEEGRIPREDFELTESNGSLIGDSKLISQNAKSRGISQLGTLGSGNHYLEIEVVDKICDERIAKILGLSEGQIIVSIHTGSRGLGHGCCTKIMEEIIEKKEVGEKGKEDIKSLFIQISKDNRLTKEEKRVEYERIKKERKEERKANKTRLKEQKRGSLQHIPFRSEIGQKYFKIMNSASNFAWVNRSMITEKVRKVLSEVFPQAKVDMIYDVCHNVAKVEEVSGVEVLVMRKGASRVLPPGHKELPSIYREIGQPVLVGGSMGTSSYLIIGAEGADKTFYSTCHGAGRLISRSRSKQLFTVEETIADMKSKDIVLKVGEREGVVEECGECYKDVEAVVNHSERIGVSKTVCRVKPILVLKG